MACELLWIGTARRSPRGRHLVRLQSHDLPRPATALTRLVPPLPAEALEAGKRLAAAHGCVVAISGAEDLVTDGTRVLCVANGVPLLQQITATGCSGVCVCEGWGEEKVCQGVLLLQQITATGCSGAGQAAAAGARCGGVRVSQRGRARQLAYLAAAQAL